MSCNLCHRSNEWIQGKKCGPGGQFQLKEQKTSQQKQKRERQKGQEERQKKQKLLTDRFGSRPQMNADEFFQAFFAHNDVSKEVVLGVRDVLEEVLESDLSFLRDSDDFSKNLSIFWEFDSMANVELVLALEKRFKITITDAEAESTKTVRDLVGLVQAKAHVAA